MKHFTRYLLTVTIILLGVIKVMAQTECANIEWMRFFNNDQDIGNIITAIDSDYSQIIAGDYRGSPNIGGLTNLPSASNFLSNAFIGQIDSSGIVSWLKVAESFAYNSPFYFSYPVLDSAGDIYTVLNFTWKTVFGGTIYVTNGQQKNALFIKMSPQGQVLATHLFDNCSLMIRHIDESQNLYFSADFEDTISIDNHTYNSNGGKDILVFKLNAQLQLLWAQQIGGNKDETNDWQESIKADNQNNIYIAGFFKSSSLTLGNTTLNNPYSSVNLPVTFMAKINANGNYSWVKSIADPDFSLEAVATDNSGNIYLAGGFTDTLTLGTATIPAVPANSFNSILVQYNPVADSFSSMVLRGGWNRGEHLLYLPQKNTMVLSGIYEDTIDFYIDSAVSNNFDFYVLDVDVLSIGSEQMLLPKWVVHSDGSGGESSPVLAKDFKDNIYLSGLYSDDLGAGAFGNYTFPAIPGNISNVSNGYQAKLSFLNREVTVSNGVLTAVQDSALYQWLDCGNGMQPVAGATQQSFDPGQPASYAVQVSNSFCSVVSECISTTGISETQRLSQVRIYPNPVAQMLHLKGLPPGTQVTVFDVLSRTVYSATAKEASLDINTHRWSTGVYMLRLSMEGAVHLEKVVKV